MSAKERVEPLLTDIRAFADGEPAPDLYERSRPLLAKLLEGVEAPKLPATLLAAPGSTVDDYRANWSHQVWYHLGELVRIMEARKQRAKAQGGDSWVNVPQPQADEELRNHLNELAKLRGLMESTPPMRKANKQRVLFEDPLLGKPDAWEHPQALEIQRDAEKGVCWQGQNPGGDWFWLTQQLPDKPVAIQFDLQPVSTLKGGLIVAFAAKALKPGTPLSVASSPSMADYYKNFDAYHFSVNRGATGYCNLRRCGPGLIMLASFSDPCPQYGKWYKVEIVKAGRQIELRVDGKPAVCYVDLGFIQPCLVGGYFGLRHFQGFRGWHRNVRIVALEE